MPTDKPLKLAPRASHLQPSTALIQSDRRIPMPRNDVMPPISVTTTYRVTEDVDGGNSNDGHYVYSRVEHPVRERVEEVIGHVEGGHAVVYSSGLSACYAAVGWVRPRRLLIAPGGYHGIQLVMQLAKTRTGVPVVTLDEHTQVLPGDLLWLETPRNPDCKMQDIELYVAKAQQANQQASQTSNRAIVAVDATFAPPPMLHALELGVDIVMHSTTKFYGGHSDLLAGVLVVRTVEEQEALRAERLVMGNVPGNLEVWLLLRSLRTMELRVRRQCETAHKLAAWLSSAPNARYVKVVHHLSLPTHPDHALARRQLKDGLFGPMMAIEMQTEALARLLPTRVQVIQDATSLGGVESLIDWRYKHDDTVPKVQPDVGRGGVGGWGC